MESTEAAHLALDPDIHLELAPDNGLEGLQTASHSSPRHHRTSSLVEGTGSTSTSAATSWNGSTSSSLPGSQSSSQSGGFPKSSAGPGGFSIELPDFASMLPSECSFSESSADDAVAPTPHTPVVLSAFEGEGLKAASARAARTEPWGQQQQHDEADDEFAACFNEMAPLDGVAPHGAQYADQFIQEEGWLPAQFPSLLNRRTLSAVMEGEHEGQDDEEQQHQQALEQIQQLSEQLQQQDGTTFLLNSSYMPSNGPDESNSAAVAGDSGGAAASAADIAGVDEGPVDESNVDVEFSSSSVIIHPDSSDQRQHQSQHMGSLDHQQQQRQLLVQPLPQPQQPLEQQQVDLAEPQQRTQTQQQHSDQFMPALQHSQGLDSIDNVDLPAVELRINSRHALEEGKGVAAGADVTAAVGAEEDEWQQANKQRLQEQQAQQLTPGGLALGQLTYSAAETQLLAADMRCHRAAVLQSLPPPPGWLARQIQQLFSCGCGSGAGAVVLEGPSEQEQVVLLLSLAKTGLSDTNEVHVGILQAVYCAFTGKAGPIPRYGAHWCEVGFQGDDPGTDLRGVGMLGLLQLLYLPYHDAAAAQKLYQLSISGAQEFPLAIVGLNITRWTLTALRAGSLTRAAHRLGSYTAAANHFYCGAFYEFYARWCQGKTMREAGFVLKQLEEYCRKHSTQLLQLAAAPDKAMAAADSKAWQPSQQLQELR